MSGATEPRAAVLRAEIAAHNAAIRQHRKARRAARAELDAIEREGQRRGLVLEPQRSCEGAVHGQPS